MDVLGLAWQLGAVLKNTRLAPVKNRRRTSNKLRRQIVSAHFNKVSSFPSGPKS